MLAFLVTWDADNRGWITSIHRFYWATFHFHFARASDVFFTFKCDVLKFILFYAYSYASLSKYVQIWVFEIRIMLCCQWRMTSEMGYETSYVYERNEMYQKTITYVHSLNSRHSNYGENDWDCSVRVLSRCKIKRTSRSIVFV